MDIFSVMLNALCCYDIMVVLLVLCVSLVSICEKKYYDIVLYVIIEDGYFLILAENTLR